MTFAEACKDFVHDAVTDFAHDTDEASSTNR
jgi:hypothetical protein